LSVLESSVEYRTLKKKETKNVVKVSRNPIAYDRKYPEALALAKKNGHISIRMMMKELSVAYPRGARIMDELNAAGLVELNTKGQRSKYIGGK